MLQRVFLLATMLICSCNIQETNNIEVPLIEVDPKESVPRKYSEIFNSISFIKLETNKESLLGRINKLIITDNNIFIDDGRINIFNKNGSHELTFGVEGRGPGEYLTITDFFVDTVAKTIEIADVRSKKNITYSLKGEFLHEWHHNINVMRFIPLGNKNYLIYNGNHFNEKDDSKWKIINSSNNHIIREFFPIDMIESEYFFFFERNNFSSISTELSFSFCPENYIYKIVDLDLYPRYLIKFPEGLEIPSSFIKSGFDNMYEFDQKLGKSGYVGMIDAFFETNSHIYFTYKYKETRHSVLFDKESLVTKVNSNMIDDMALMGRNYEVNYSMMPYFADHQSFYFLIDPIDYIESIDSLKINMSGEEWTSYLNSHPTEVEIFQTTDINDNPIIMIGRAE